MKRALLVDDNRNWPEVWRQYGDTLREHELVLARNYGDAIAALDTGRFDIIFLDHDLGDYHNGRERTGYTVLCMIEAMIHNDPALKPTEIFLVTANASGRVKMQLVINKMYGQD